MATPITGLTFSDVKTNIESADSGLTITSLNGAVTNADAGGYNVTYYTAPATSLREFRGYEHPTGVAVSSFLSSKNGQVDGATACSQAITWTYYTDGDVDFRTAGDKIYTDDPGTILLNGGGNFFSDGDYSYTISTVGVVGFVTSCL